MLCECEDCLCSPEVAAAEKADAERDRRLAEEDDVGPPAPGEGDDLENPEIGLKC